MHFFCSTLGSSGDVFPMLGLALELRRRGHRITFATNAHFEATVRKHGLAFEPLGTEEDFQRSISDPDLWHPRKAFSHVLELLKPVLKKQYEQHEALRGQNDVVALSNCLGMGAMMARDKLGIPLVTVHLQPGVIWSDHEQPVLPGLFGPRWLRSVMYRLGMRFFIQPAVDEFLKPWRRELGLPVVRDVMQWWNSPDGIVCLFPSWYAQPQADWPSPLAQADFPLWNDGSDAGLSAEVEGFLAAGAPPVVFTPGTANIHAKDFFTAAVQACEQLKCRGILLTKHQEQVPALPASVRHFAYVPLDLLLPRAAAFVHHGGIGSTSQGLAAGIPQLIMPLAHDQFDNAERVRKLGTGRWLPVAKFKGPQVTRELKTLLADQAMAAKCKAVARQMQGRQGISLAADAVEAFAKARLTSQKR